MRRRIAISGWIAALVLAWSGFVESQIVMAVTMQYRWILLPTGNGRTAGTSPAANDSHATFERWTSSLR